MLDGVFESTIFLRGLYFNDEEEEEEKAEEEFSSPLPKIFCHATAIWLPILCSHAHGFSGCKRSIPSWLHGSMWRANCLAKYL